MKKIIITMMASLILSVSSFASAGEHSGLVKESLEAGIYTYLLVEENGNEYWIAGPKTQVGTGKVIQFDEEMWMENFKSQTLNRTFDKVMFASNIRWQGMTAVEPAAAMAQMGATQASVSKDAGLLTVEKIFSDKQNLAGQLVSVQGEVVKVSNNIMGRTWVHIKDGTGQGEQAKIIFRSKTESANVGDKVTAKGVLAIDQDFGYGYVYPVIVNDSTFVK